MGPARLARATLAALLLALALAGCAGLARAYDVAPNGLSRSDDALRRMLVFGRPDSAFLHLAPERSHAPGDALLRDLYQGIVAHYAGEYAASNQHLHRAAELADERMTKSVSREAISFFTNDRVLPYEPGRTERLLIPYFGALNFLRLGDLAGATVEARRLAFELQHYDDAGSDADRPLRAALRELTGAIFEAAGERNDAAVAFRNAAALGRTVAPGVAGDTAIGLVVLVVEHGFVAHRVEASLNVMLHAEELSIFADGDAAEKVALAGLVAARAVDHALRVKHFDNRFGTDTRALLVPAPDEPALRWRCRGEECTDSTPPPVGKPYLLRVAWPAFREQARLPAAASVWFASASAAASASACACGSGSGDGTGGGVELAFADVSRAIVADFERERGRLIARTIARGAVKLAVTQSAERRATERDETVGWLVGVLGNVGSALLEQADTRSWHLLPGGIAILRMPLAAGTHELAVEAGGGAGRTLPLGSVHVEPGRTTFVSTRAW
jgi:hypothetical protein